ncbi:MAG TPA: DNA recombination protein RmuC, partial [Rhodoferax sp.]|nr:DNA recombination protein RmuC [Rhodoferax sp.]
MAWWVWPLLGMALLNLLALVWLARSQRGNGDDLEQQLQRKELQDLRVQLQAATERLERELRTEITESARGGRQELSQNL